jgi:hypothetical protein
MDNDLNFTTSIRVNKTPEEVFDAINNVRGWWIGEIEGSTDKIGDEFAYHYKDIHYSKQKITELIPGKRVVWHVLDANLSFVMVNDEWKGTYIVFDISKKGDKTEVVFTHIGLVPILLCFERCSNGWSFYINKSLKSFINTGKGDPNK